MKPPSYTWKISCSYSSAVTNRKTRAMWYPIVLIEPDSDTLIMSCNLKPQFFLFCDSGWQKSWWEYVHVWLWHANSYPPPIQTLHQQLHVGTEWWVYHTFCHVTQYCLTQPPPPVSPCTTPITKWSVWGILEGREGRGKENGTRKEDEEDKAAYIHTQCTHCCLLLLMCMSRVTGALWTMTTTPLSLHVCNCHTPTAPWLYQLLHHHLVSPNA